MNEETNQLIALAEEIEDLKKRVQEAEGELSIVKGIGNNSPEMKSLKSEVQALKQQLHTERVNFLKQHDKEIALVREDVQIEILRLEKINNEHQKLNGELREDNKKLAKQVDDLLSRLDKLRHLGVI